MAITVRYNASDRHYLDPFQVVVVGAPAVHLDQASQAYSVARPSVLAAAEVVPWEVPASYLEVQASLDPLVP